MNLEIRQAELADIERLSRELIPADKAEILAMGHGVFAGLKQTWENSVEAHAMYLGEDLAVCFGVTKAMPLVEEYHPWMISTPLIFPYRKSLVPISRIIHNAFTRRYPLLTNYVDARHTRAVKWLRWLGAEIEPPIEIGPFKRLFHKFTLRSPYVR